MVQPQPSRPRMPTDYGVSTTDNGLLPWSHARERLEPALVYWISTVRPDGRPHVMPVWGVWLDEKLYFDGSPETRRGRNIAANPALAVHIESGGAGKDVVIVEGFAREVHDVRPELATRLAAAYTAKYTAENYAPSAELWNNGGLYELQPRVAFAWTDMREATRWRFTSSD